MNNVLPVIVIVVGLTGLAIVLWTYRAQVYGLFKKPPPPKKPPTQDKHTLLDD